jgi:hypothetical protein
MAARAGCRRTADDRDELGPQGGESEPCAAKDESKDNEEGARPSGKAPEEDRGEGRASGRHEDDEPRRQLVGQVAEAQEARDRSCVHQCDERRAVGLALDLARIAREPDGRHELREGASGFGQQRKS